MSSWPRCIWVAYRWLNVALATNVKTSGTKFMMPLIIRCFHNPDQQAATDNQFFILSKGSNAGKPSLQPWANSFVAIASNKAMRDFYYWLTFGLYKAQGFKIFQRGSVIPFINLQQARNLIMPAAKIIYPDWQAFKNILQQLELLELRSNEKITWQIF